LAVRKSVIAFWTAARLAGVGEAAAAVAAFSTEAGRPHLGHDVLVLPSTCQVAVDAAMPADSQFCCVVLIIVRLVSGSTPLTGVSPAK
jgi:hypothetical protein